MSTTKEINAEFANVQEQASFCPQAEGLSVDKETELLKEDLTEEDLVLEEVRAKQELYNNKEEKSMETHQPSKSRELLNRVLYWEATLEDGRTPERRILKDGKVVGFRPQTHDEVMESERLAKVVKASYTINRISAENKTYEYPKVEGKWHKGSLCFRLDNNHMLAVRFDKKNGQRVFRVFRREDGKTRESLDYAGMEFPMVLKDAQPQLKVNIPALVYVLTHHKARVTELSLWIEEQKEYIRQGWIDEVCAEYVLDMGMDKLGYISWYEDGEQMASPEFSEDEEDEIMFWHRHCVDSKRSNEFTLEIVQSCNDEGILTKPLRKHNHKSTLESLRWLTGIGGKQGVVASDWLTRDDRQALLGIGKASWEAYKAYREVQRADEEAFWSSIQ